jgi:Lon protease-like protein
LNLHGTQQTYLGDVDRVLQEFGYRIFKIYEQKNEWQKDSPLLRRCNVAYMSAKFADANPLSAVLEIHKLRKEIEVLKQKG